MIGSIPNFFTYSFSVRIRESQNEAFQLCNLLLDIIYFVLYNKNTDRVRFRCNNYTTKYSGWSLSNLAKYLYNQFFVEVCA